MPEKEAEPRVFVPLCLGEGGFGQVGGRRGELWSRSLKPGHICRVGRKQQGKALPST